MIPLIILSVVAFLFGGLPGVLMLWAGLAVLALGVNLICAPIYWTYRFVRFVILAFWHVGGDLCRIGRAS